MNEFRIVFPTELQKYEYYDPPEVLRDEISNLTYAQIVFAMMYELRNEWHIEIADKQYRFDVIDTMLIWEDLPEFLENVNKGVVIQTLDFVEEWILTCLEVKNDFTGELSVSIINSLAKDENSHSPAIRISKKDFFDTWYTFAQQIIQLLIENQLISTDDESIEAYLNRLPRIS